MRYFERRRRRVDFIKSCIQQVEKQGYWLSGEEKVYDTVEHLQGMLQRELRTMV